MKKSGQKHSIENVFVLMLFAVFAITIVAVLALGARSYKRLVERDNDSYNERIITSYVVAQIRTHDEADAVEIGGFDIDDATDGVNTLHLYEEIDGFSYEMRIYYYEGQIYELFSSTLSELEPEDGTPVMEAHALNFAWKDGCIHITSEDTDGRQSEATVGIRSDESGVVS